MVVYFSQLSQMNLGIAQTKNKCHSSLYMWIGMVKFRKHNFFKCEQGTTGERVADLIQSTGQALGLDRNNCSRQYYDGAGNMAGVSKGAASIIESKYPKALHFQCTSHKLNHYVAHSCKIASVMNMMDAVTCLANFFNYTPQRQKRLENHLKEYCKTLKTKLIPLCTYDG